MKEYEINGVKVQIKPVTFGQIKAIAALADDWDVDLDFSTASTEQIQAKLSDLLGKAIDKIGVLFEIMFPDVDFSGVDWNGVSIEKALEVVESFFTSTPRLKKVFERFIGTLA